MKKIWDLMNQEQRNKYESINSAMMDAVTADEVRYYANQLHELLDQIDIEKVNS
ncbi:MULTISPECIES: hypothetical protein [Metabacillus]|uniref:hypothetical protein n=1 Tax=Metabacillus TaxID=2675233 RepID=UPI00158DFE86|nr:MULTISPECIES: hypothetical protein [Metabacillus]MCM3444003.1 hypothetical protein [Metabacillus halosaccharovorans]